MTFKFDRHHLFKKIGNGETYETNIFKLVFFFWTPVHYFFPVVKMVKMTLFDER